MANIQSNLVMGQRWVSEAEPELGLGTVLQVEGRRAVLVFPANGETRQYAISNAPLNRVRYAVGDTVSDGAGQTFVVESIDEAGGLITYRGQGEEMPEGRLSDQLAFNRPQDRLLAGNADDGAAFELRRRVLEHLHHYKSSPLRGLLGGRVQLIPHQLYVVESVVQRAYPRVLLSDEIGLGKTIEACLILHRKLMLGRVRRALILVPPALVHQWFVELLRRFSLQVAIFDEERCEAIESNPESGNPFLEDQLVLCDVDWLAGHPARARQAVEAGWDLLIVDEAHHLEWEPGEPSAGYAVVEALSRSSHGLLLLTATPEETGGAGHFARLRLLDPDRYAELGTFERESEGYSQLVPLVETLASGGDLSGKDKVRVRRLGLDPSVGRDTLLDELIDCYGPGRVIFRNTRHIIKGFPERVPHLVPIEDTDEAVLAWLMSLLTDLASDKVLAIAHTRAAAQALYDAVKARSTVTVGLFHEDMTLLERDRQAAWFADPEGARLLLASEIGGEGRNFQFAHHLVLLDMPENPEVLEQRIGRLDRIGQAHAIHIHVPYRKGTRDEVLALWVHEALDAFRKPLPGAHEIYMRFRKTLRTTPWKVGSAEWKAFIVSARKERLCISERVAHGRDRLLELHSYRADEAQHWVEAIRAVDETPTLEHFLLELFEAHGVHPEQLEPRCWLLKPDALFTDDFPGFPREGMVITFDRNMALAREDVGFMSWDHPMLHGAVERVLSSSEGNASFAAWRADVGTRFLVEAVFVLEAMESRTDAAHYLPATPIHLLLDDQGAPWPERPGSGELVDIRSLGDTEREFLREQMPASIRHAESEAQRQAETIRLEAHRRLEEAETAEIRRLHALQQRNDHITDRELEHRASRCAAALQEIADAPMRLDALRWIWCVP